MKKLYLSLLLICCAICQSYAQKAYTITFNEAGQITSDLPALVTSRDTILFMVVGTQASYEQRVLNAYQLYLQTITNLDKNTNLVYKVFDDIGIDDANFRPLLWTVQSKMAGALLNWLASDPAIQPILEKNRNVEEDKTKLKEFVHSLGHHVDSTILNALVIPDPRTLANISYVIEPGYTGAFPAAQIPCMPAMPLAEKQSDCHWLFYSEPITNLSTVIPFYRFTYKLRLRNNSLAVLTEQLKSLDGQIKKSRAIDLTAQKAGLQAALTTLKGADGSDTQQLFAWMDSKVKGAEDKTHYTHLVTVYDKTPAGGLILKAINAAIANTYKTSLLDPDVLTLMLELSWVTQGQNLTMNPLTNGLTTDPKGQIDNKTKELSDSTISLNALNNKIDLFSGMLKAASQGCCQTPKYAVQLKAYNDMIDLQKNIIKAQSQLTIDIQKLKDQQPKSAKDQQDYKRQLLSDSLFYSGFLDVTNEPATFNKLGYHYMRHHDELNDYRHMDIKVQQEINEKQYLEAIAENHDPNKKIVIKYSDADITSDVDFIGAQFGSQALAVHDPSLDEIYTIYNNINKLYIPYSNGVINLPVTPLIDNTPNYISKTNVTPDADKYPTLRSYKFQDSASSKDLTGSFNLRINKLYHFRLTAGIAYSTLSRNTYTINAANNTATVAPSFVGAAPAFGVQYFIRAIDIQHDKAFQDGWPPFIYIGYIYNDAPLNNFLVGGGFEILSGFAIAGGLHFGTTQQIFTDEGNLQVREKYKTGYFATVTFGLEAFKAIFNTPKSLPNPGSK